MECLEEGEKEVVVLVIKNFLCDAGSFELEDENILNVATEETT
jgi:hypothetical protein